MYVNNLNLHEIKTEKIEDYAGDFGMIGSMLIGKIEQKTNIGFKSKGIFENNNNAIDVDYDSEYFFTCWLYKIDTPEINTANTPQQGTGTDFKQDIVEYVGKNCFFPASSTCFLEN